ncbi:hypothetical protein KAI87_06470 [Myxococcota bacterium]|nr:hypothetical protein [Myxococcota bacterium]
MKKRVCCASEYQTMSIRALRGVFVLLIFGFIFTFGACAPELTPNSLLLSTPAGHDLWPGLIIDKTPAADTMIPEDIDLNAMTMELLPANTETHDSTYGERFLTSTWLSADTESAIIVVPEYLGDALLYLRPATATTFGSLELKIDGKSVFESPETTTMATALSIPIMPGEHKIDFKWTQGAPLAMISALETSQWACSPVDPVAPYGPPDALEHLINNGQIQIFAPTKLPQLQPPMMTYQHTTAVVGTKALKLELASHHAGAQFMVNNVLINSASFKIGESWITAVQDKNPLCSNNIVFCEIDICGEMLCDEMNVSLTPGDSSDVLCDAKGYECGQFSDECGFAVDCGYCGGDYDVCGGEGVPFMCGCTPDTSCTDSNGDPICTGEHQWLKDGCGGTYQCRCDY